MTNFASATAVTAVGSHEYTANFPDAWCIGTVPHGGFVAAVFMRVASTHFSTTLRGQNQPHTITFHLEFLRRTQVGPATFTVRDAKLGRMTSTIHVALTQDGREEVVGYITNSNMATESGISFVTDYTLLPPPYPVDLARLKRGDDAHWAEQKEMPFPKFRKAMQQVRLHFPRKGQLQKGMADEWITLRSGERFTQESIAFICDAWPQLIEPFKENKGQGGRGKGKAGAVDDSKLLRDIQESKSNKDKPATYWYPTLLMNLDVKKVLPEDGVEFLFVRVVAKKIHNGRVDLEVVIRDEGGDIVALSNHVALVVDSSRNTASRRKQADTVQGKL